MISGRTVWKYNLRLGINEISVPKGSNVISTALQEGSPVIWIEVDPSLEKTSKVLIYLLETDEYFPNFEFEFEFLGTLLLDNNSYVLHVYYITLDF